MTVKPQRRLGHVTKHSEQPQWVRTGLPLPQGTLDGTQNADLMDENGKSLNGFCTSVNHWPDGSVKWLMCDLVAERSGPVFFTTQQSEAPAVTTTKPETTVRLKNKTVTLPHGLLLTFSMQPDDVNHPITIETREANALVQRYQINFESGFDHCVLQIQIEECTATGELHIRPHIHNTAASVHPGGCWDLGDPNSLILPSLSITLHSKQASFNTLAIQEPSGTSRQLALNTAAPITLQQHSSGGPHWDSANHLDRDGRVTPQEAGYTLHVPGADLIKGSRATPCITTQYGYCATPQAFWQNAPSLLAISATEMHWHLFSQPTELQPGESKTWLLTLGPGEQAAQFTLDPTLVENSKALAGTSLIQAGALANLMQNGIEGEHSFFAKREAIDEYGWRNFGDLYADHEALNVTDEQGLFISHYNNQYDPLLGFTLRWLATGNPQWHELANDLLWHILDIDLYKTDQDKAEYNHGLFWHTDHYLPAETATHRTYSRHHKAVYEGHQGGGGPGGQHCYTGGLALQYLLTGDERIKDAVTNMTHWVRCFYNGAPSLLARLFRFVTVDRKAGQLTNIGWIAPGYKYPLDRGTANYLNALIDLHNIAPQSALLAEMAEVIRETLSPSDDLSTRNLQDVENHWFYVIFLQALARYLLLKEQCQQNDAEYAYARLALLHYADWLKDNDPPYLSQPEKLEFPTDTWAGQDLRKACVLYYAAYFANQDPAPYRQRAEYFYHYCSTHLAQSAEVHTTRIQALLMQNTGVREWQQTHTQSPIGTDELRPFKEYKPSLFGRLIRDCWRILKQGSLRNEIHWVKTRISNR